MSALPWIITSMSLYVLGGIGVCALASPAERASDRFMFGILIWPISVAGAVVFGAFQAVREVIGK